MNYLKLNGDIMMKKLFYVVAASLLFTSGLSYAKSKKVPDFSGEWGGRYEGCEYNSSSWFKFKQKGNKVTGEWHGSAKIAWTGKLKGKIIGRKMFVYYCSDYEGYKYYSICPKYEKIAYSYFIRAGNKLIRYNLIGGKNGKYEIDEKAEKIYKILPGGDIPVMKDKECSID